MKKAVMAIICGLVFSGEAYSLPLKGITDLDGRPGTVSHGKKAELVMLWATWCPECKEKLKSKLGEMNQRPEVAVLAVNIESDAERVKHFIKSENISVPILLDSQRELRKELKAYSVPHWAVYQRKGESSVLIDSAAAFDLPRIETAIEVANRNEKNK